MRRMMSVSCALLFFVTVLVPAATAAPGAGRVAEQRLCTAQTTELRSDRDHNKANVTVCVLVDGGVVRGETVVDCWFYKGLGWWNDQPCQLVAQFLVEFRRGDVTVQVSKSAVLEAGKETGDRVTARMAGGVTCPAKATSVRVTAGISVQQYWTDNGDEEKPYGLVAHTVPLAC